MTIEEAVYIVEKWYPIRNGSLNKKTIGVWYEAERILRRWDNAQPRSCSCEYRTLARLVHSFYNQYETEVKELYEKRIQEGAS